MTNMHLDVDLLATTTAMLLSCFNAGLDRLLHQLCMDVQVTGSMCLLGGR